jgi:hypothetical protein
LYELIEVDGPTVPAVITTLVLSMLEALVQVTSALGTVVKLQVTGPNALP